MTVTSARPNDRRGEGPTQVAIRGDRLIVTGLELRDWELSHFVGEHDEIARPQVVERALKVGLIALCNAGVTVNVDYIQREFARLLIQVHESHESAERVLEQSLRENFADRDGRLPRTLEAFLGEKGSLRHFVNDLFDEERRDSAIGRMRTLLAGYFDGDGALLAPLLDPTRVGSPLHSFRNELRQGLTDLSERLTRLEAGQSARAEQRARGTAKGVVFEDAVEERLAAIARGTGDLVERTGTMVGDSLRAKTGDLVLLVNPAQTGGCEVRVAIEAKDGPVGLAAIGRQLDGARRNRRAAVALAVFSRGNAPTGCAPLTMHGVDVLCEMDVADPLDVGFEAAVRLARALAIASARQQSVEIDAEAVRRHLEVLRNRLDAVRGMKSRLTSITGLAGEVGTALDTLRADMLECLTAIDSELRVAGIENPAAGVSLELAG